MEVEKKLKAYVAGKLNADAVGYIQNMHRMIKTAKQLRNLGAAVYVPCNDFLEGLVDGDFSYKDYFENSQPWLLVSDLMYVCPGWETSEGTKKEIQFAKDNGIAIFYEFEKLQYQLNHQGI